MGRIKNGIAYYLLYYHIIVPLLRLRRLLHYPSSSPSFRGGGSPDQAGLGTSWIPDVAAGSAGADKG